MFSTVPAVRPAASTRWHAHNECAMLYCMSLIVTDGGAEPKRDMESALPPPVQRKERPPGFQHTATPGQGASSRLARWALCAGVITALLTALLAGMWLLARGAAYWVISYVLPLPYPAHNPSATLGLAWAATGCGLALLVCAAAVAFRRHWAWTLLTISAAATTILCLAASSLSGVVDWSGMAAACSLSLVAALPTVREGLLAKPRRAPASSGGMAEA